jgi:hypothetical protein
VVPVSRRGSGSASRSASSPSRCSWSRSVVRARTVCWLRPAHLALTGRAEPLGADELCRIRGGAHPPQPPRSSAP